LRGGRSETEEGGSGRATVDVQNSSQIELELKSDAIPFHFDIFLNRFAEKRRSSVTELTLREWLADSGEFAFSQAELFCLLSPQIES